MKILLRKSAQTLLTTFPILLIGYLMFPQIVHAQFGGAEINVLSTLGNVLAAPLLNALMSFAGWISIAVLKIVSILAWLGGMTLNYVADYTIVNMKENLGDGSVIDQTWRTVRDVANMAFIFVLLYAGIQTILGIGKDVQRLIRNIVIVAILINFSLFFTKVIIDISNVLAITFYGAMSPGALGDSLNGGIANAIMDALKFQSIWETTGVLDGSRLLVIGVMGTIFVLIVAFVLFAIALMLIIRFAILILVMILSPLAFISFILPGGAGMDKYQKQWVQALLGQSFFAPIFFMMAWITVKISQGLLEKQAFFANSGGIGDVINGAVNADGTGIVASSGGVALVVNFIIVIVFLIASIILAKSWADKAGGGISKMATSWAGKASMGVAGFAGRQSLGKFGSYVGDNEKLKEAAAKGSISARLALKAGRKTGERSFDLRSTGVGGIIGAGKGQKGGFAGDMKKKMDEETKFATSLGPSDRAKFKAEEKLKKAQAVYDATEKKGDTEETKNARERLEEARDRKNYYFGVDEKEVKRLKAQKEETRDKELKKIADKEKMEMEADPLIKAEEDAKKEIQRLEDELKRKERRMAVTSVPAEKKAIAAEIKAQMDELDKAEENAKAITVAADARRSNIKDTYDEGRKIANDKYKTETGEIKEVNAANDRKFAYANNIEKSLWAKGLGYNYKASAAIRKGKSKKERLADLAKEVAKEDEEAAGGGEEKPEEKKPESGGESGEKKT